MPIGGFHAEPGASRCAVIGRCVVFGDSPVLNDHGDTGYDVAVLDRLGRVNDKVVPILHDLKRRPLGSVFDVRGPSRHGLATSHGWAGRGPVADGFRPALTRSVPTTRGPAHHPRCFEGKRSRCSGPGQGPPSTRR